MPEISNKTIQELAASQKALTEKFKREQDKNAVAKIVAEILAREIRPLIEGQTSAIESFNVSKEFLAEVQRVLNSPEVKVKIEAQLDPAMVKIEIPEIKIPDINVPEIKTEKLGKILESAIKSAVKGIKITPNITVKAPTVNIPKQKEVKVNIPDSFYINVNKSPVDRDNPLPVILTDDNGKFYKAIAQIVAGSGGGRSAATTVKIDDVSLTAIAEGYAAEGAALGSGVLIQGDDGTDRQNILVDALGHLQVDVLSGAAGGEQYPDNEAVGAAKKGNIALGTDGSNYQILATDAVGHLQVDVLSGGGSEQYVDGTLIDAGYKGNIILGRSTGSGDYEVISVNSSGELVVDIDSFPAINLGQRTMAGSLSVVFASDIADTTYIGDIKFGEALPAGTALIGDVGIMGNTVVDGSGSDLHVLIDAAGHIQVDVISMPTVTVDLGTDNDVVVAGDIAHDAADSGNPIKVGAKAIAHGTNPTAVAADDRTDLYANRAGVPFVIGGHPNIKTLRANYDAAKTNEAIITIAGGLKIVVTKISVTASNANTVNVAALIGFAAATTPTTTGVVLAHPGIAPGSGIVEGSGAGMLGVGTDGEDLRITSTVPTTGSIDVVVSYYTIES